MHNLGRLLGRIVSPKQAVIIFLGFIGLIFACLFYLWKFTGNR